MPDAAVEAAIAHWAPRFVQGGVDYNDFVRTTARIDRWEQWLPEWNRTADEHARLAAEAEADGHSRSAGEAWIRAAVSRHFGKFVWVLDLDLAAEATHRSVDELRRGHRHLDPTAERIEVAGVVANVRRPAGAERPPVVVLLPGLDSTKEELFSLEQTYLSRGMATVSVDGPGQGETGLTKPLQVEYEAGIAPVFDLIAARPDLDGDRIGVCGVSLGGYYAPRVAAAIGRVRAVAAVSGTYRFVDIWSGLPQISRDTFRVKAHKATEEEAYELALGFDLTGICARIEVPALYVTGSLDRLVKWEYTQRQADETPGGRFICFEGGNHIVANMPYAARSAVADWLSDRLAEVER